MNKNIYNGIVNIMWETIMKIDNPYNFKVVYDIKHVKKTSALYGVLTQQTVKFATLQSAFLFARDMKGKKNSRFEVIGTPVIERIGKENHA